MIDLCKSCAHWDICYLNRYMHFRHHNTGECDIYVCKLDIQQNRSAIIKAHPPHSARKTNTNITRAEPADPCPKCHSVNTYKYGHFKIGENLIRRYKCSDCGEKFTPEQKQEPVVGDDKGELSSMQLRQKWKGELASLKREGESFEDVVVRLIKEHKKS